ncbi:hypothetical protein D9613_005516 [Agrocybe pediades]|uniref:DNA replication factor Cdt1 C-terminal domain-containing protein n=1 Tax=Agrocybe pediades TaxID=84607 RepID=A0A8H4QZF6_9AGAR|nr:hypothetical protein D9613_005516 [Agrocybe pediades]
MSDLYTSLQVSPRKKRLQPEFDDENTMTPKKMRTAPPTPPPSVSRSVAKLNLPHELSRLYNVQTALHHALSHALATCAISPTSDLGLVKNVLNHISLTTYSGFSSSFDIDDLKRLCWLWEWDMSDPKAKLEEKSEDNPFLDAPASPSGTGSADWTRGAMGIIISPATHFSKTDRKRVPAYGIGIEVEMDIDKDMGAGMAAVARWTANSDSRRKELLKKLTRWVELHDGSDPLPKVPLADIPELTPPKVSALTRTLASCSPSAATSVKLPPLPSSPSRSPVKRSAPKFAVPSLIFPSTSPTKKNSILFPQTPSRRDRDAGSEPPQTPLSAATSPSKDPSLPSTPVHQKGANDSSKTPSTARRQALYERIRQRSLSASPTKTPRPDGSGSTMTRDQMAKLNQEELRRRCLLGRLSGVAESIWMLFSHTGPSGSSTPSRKRRALPTSDVVTAIIKSSPVPLSTSEANDSIAMLIKLCPFFLRKLDISGDEWLEMPAPTTASSSVDSSPTKPKLVVPSSPSRKGKEESAQELLNRSPRRVKRETGGLREVREIIRRELELQD